MKQDIKNGDGNTQIGVEGDIKGNIIINPKPPIEDERHSIGPFTTRCPNCGDPVSRYAEECGNTKCKHPVRSHFDAIEAEAKRKERERICKNIIFGSIAALLFAIFLRNILPDSQTYFKKALGLGMIFPIFFILGGIGALEGIRKK